VLGNEGFLDINWLRLYRLCEYLVAEHFVISNMSRPNPILSLIRNFAFALIQLLINVGKAYAGVVYKPYKGAKADGWRRFSKGLGKGVGHLLFRRRGLVIGGQQYGLCALYDAIRKHIKGNTLSFILASHFAQGFEEAKMAKEEEY
jgi:hypothetical protein